MGLIVIDDEDSQTLQEIETGQMLGHFRRLFLQTGVKPESGALPWFALHAQGAAHQFHELLGDGQPQTRTPIFAGHGPVRLGEGLEDPGLDLRGNADAGIADLKAQPHRLFLPLLQELDVHHYLPLVRELNGIVQEVGENLTEAPGIAQQGRGGLGGQPAGQLQPLGLGVFCEEFQELFDYLV